MNKFKHAEHSDDIIAVDCHSGYFAALIDETIEKKEISMPQKDK